MTFGKIWVVLRHISALPTFNNSLPLLKVHKVPEEMDASTRCNDKHSGRQIDDQAQATFLLLLRAGADPGLGDDTFVEFGPMSRACSRSYPPMLHTNGVPVDEYETY